LQELEKQDAKKTEQRVPDGSEDGRAQHGRDQKERHKITEEI
jgi:hypothetical protein